MGRQHIAIQREQSDELFLKRFLRWSQTTGLQIKFPQVSQTLAHLFDTPDVSERYSYKLQSGLSDKFLSLPSQNLTLQVSSAGLVPCEFVKFPDMKKTCHTNHVHFCHIPKSQCVVIVVSLLYFSRVSPRQTPNGSNHIYLSLVSKIVATDNFAVVENQ